MVMDGPRMVQRLIGGRNYTARILAKRFNPHMGKDRAMQVHIFLDGCFVAHRVYITGSPCRFSIWFDSSGILTDAERIDKRQRGYAVKPASAAWISLKNVARRIAVTAGK